MQQSMNERERFVSAAESDAWLNIAYVPHVFSDKPLPDRALPIAEMANFFNVTHRTLHFYEEKKLLQPERQGSMRVYPPNQIRLMALINLCRETGMPIAQIQELLTELSGCESAEESQERFCSALAERRKELVAAESLIRRQMQQIVVALGELDANDESGANEGYGHPPFLTELEFQCLRLMAEGYMPVRIAKALDMAMEQVMMMETNIVRKFGASNRFQAVAKAVLLGIVSD